MSAPTCAECCTDKPVHVVMKPGLDRKEWWLCVRCYLAYVKPEPALQVRR